MKRYRCDDCDYECKLETTDDAPVPDSCVQLGHNVDWVKSIVLKEPSNNPQINSDLATISPRCNCEKCTGLSVESHY